MEVIDHSYISDETAALAFAKAGPCSICCRKDGLAIGVIKTGASAGRLLLFCLLCQLEPTESVKD